jgi:hypothetical protein
MTPEVQTPLWRYACIVSFDQQKRSKRWGKGGNEVKIPGFSAEASLYTISKHYHAIGAFSQERVVYPAATVGEFCDAYVGREYAGCLTDTKRDFPFCARRAERLWAECISNLL